MGASQPCCDLLREKTDITVLGNHDAAVAGRMGYDYYRAAARKAGNPSPCFVEVQSSMVGKLAV